MPENNKKLDKKQMDDFRKQLQKMKEDILHDIKNMSQVRSGTDKDNSDVSGHALHMADVATDMYDREFSLGLASNDRELLFKLQSALKRVDDNTFGACRHCQKPIPLIRLKAIPYTETCLKCQEELEKKTPR
ncbi:MAG: TraR/DksA family transcriptional regulator [Candidatus Omnitrophota bacterium]|nr:TraR/DksA family transcriptional regulator [Candidatus Omnitrophota bacterium]MDZ4241612.1 TraR/DksA family transcriptional regulator [Candidatus Omnitrophota bacterium]